MGKRRFMYYGSILGMSITFAMFSVMEAFLMKIVVDIAQKGCLLYTSPSPRDS